MIIRISRNIIIIFLIAIIVIAGALYINPFKVSSLATTDTRPTEFSTTGPIPPPIPDENIVTSTKLQTLAITTNYNYLDDTPEYEWTHGCGPTAVAMIFGYYDVKYDTSFLIGSAGSQVSIVSSIASQEHYDDYSMPIDDENTGILRDVSETGIPHVDNCIADYMGTSVSKLDLYYGWSYVYKLISSINQYATYRDYEIEAHYFDKFTLSDMKNEIDEGRPFIVFMNADGIGGSDHFATAVGYSDDNILIHTTWATNSFIETPLLPESEQFGISGVVFTTNPVTGEGPVVSMSIPGFEFILIIVAILGLILLKRHR